LLLNLLSACNHRCKSCFDNELFCTNCDESLFRKFD